MIKICIVNRNFPPYRGATGYHASMLADYLTDTGRYDVSAVTLGDKDLLDQAVQVHAIRPNYTGRNKALRLLGSGREGYRLIKKALSLNADFYIILTDPPLLNYWAARLLKQEKWALWTMDLFPQGFVAGGLAKASDLKTRHYVNTLKAGLPNLLISLGQVQRTYLKDIYPESIPTVSLPIGLRTEVDSHSDVQSSWSSQNKITLGYIGNLSEAHEPGHISRIAHDMDANRMQLILACYGVHAAALKKSLANLDHVIIMSEVDEEHMSSIDVHLVSLAPQWTHVCVPSKALSAIQYGRPVLFLGEKQSDTATYIGKAGWTISNQSELREWLSTVTKESIQAKADHTQSLEGELRRRLQAGWKKLDDYIQQSC